MAEKHHAPGIELVLSGRLTTDGAGVRLRRVFGYDQVPRFDPFLMLDDFGSEDPTEYLAGFPWHPHRGIETVTYLLAGEVAHGDSIGNRGTIGPGDVQWMTAGSGVIHEEMPKLSQPRLRGFQLWVNLPAARKMMEPRYRGITSEEIPEVELDRGVRAKLIAGKVEGRVGPVKDLVVDVTYMDVTLMPAARLKPEVPRGHRAFAYVISGQARMGAEPGETFEEGAVLLFGVRDVEIRAGNTPLRLLVAFGRPLGEPVAWGGPIVMNTQAELDQAFAEYRAGKFVRHGHDPERPARS